MTVDRVEKPIVRVLLGTEANYLARKFAAEQETPQKRKQVYLNTLAVYAVHTYLGWQQIESDLEQSDSWHPVLRMLFDVADLMLPGVGKLECCPFIPGKTACPLAIEVIEERIGYIAVQFEENANEVKLIGFMPPVGTAEPPKESSIEEFQPLDSLIDHLYRLELGRDYVEQSEDEVAVRVRDRLTDQSLSEIVAKFEFIYRTYDKNKRRYSGGDVLAGLIITETEEDISEKSSVFIVDHESFDEGQQIEFQELAEELLEKLGEIWGEEPNEIGDVETGVIASQIGEPPISIGKTLVNLRKWLQGVFEEGLQTLEEILDTQKSASAYRGDEAPRWQDTLRLGQIDPENSTDEVCKVIPIELETEHLLNLIVTIRSEIDNWICLLLQVFPSQAFLPPNLQLKVLDESGEIVLDESDQPLEARSRSESNLIQLQFNVPPGEQFSVQVALGNKSITREFVT